MQQLVNYRWPGNARLKNVVERAVVLCRGEHIDQEDLLLSKLSTAGDSAGPALLEQPFQPSSMDEMERQHILATLNFTNWNKSRASVLLGIERSTLDRKIRRYGLADDSASSSLPTLPEDGFPAEG